MNPANRLNYFSIACGLWFAATGAFWPYYTNLFVAYPVGLLGLYLWYRADKAGYKGTPHQFALWIHLVGLFISLGALFLFK